MDNYSLMVKFWFVVSIIPVQFWLIIFRNSSMEEHWNHNPNVVGSIPIFDIIQQMYLNILFLPLFSSIVCGFFGRFIGANGSRFISTTS